MHTRRFLFKFDGENPVCPQCAFAAGVEIHREREALLQFYAPPDADIWSKADLKLERWLTGHLEAQPSIGRQGLGRIIRKAELRARGGAA